jgi:hypothetical protein
MTRTGPKPSTTNTFHSDAVKYHEHGHLFRECPLNNAHKEGNPEGRKDKDEFVQLARKRRQGGRKQPAQVSKDPSISNKFAILQDQPENPTTPTNPNVPPPDNGPQSTGQRTKRPPQGKESDLPPLDIAQDLQDLLKTEDEDAEMELEEKDLAGVDLEHLEHAYRHQKLYTIPRDQLWKVNKVFLKSSAGSSTQARKSLGIQGSQSKNPNKAQKDEKKRGRKSTNKLIQEIGHFMVNSGQIHLISDNFPPLPTPPVIMKIISWNIRGLNGRSKQKMLRDLILAEKPNILLLQEIKCTSENIDKLLPYCWKQGVVASTDATGTAGGLAILWNTNAVLLENFLTTKWSITTDYRLIGSNKPGHLTNVYGPASPRDKKAFLRSLSYISSLTQYNRWIVGGDFNIIRILEEKKGGSRRLD